VQAFRRLINLASSSAKSPTLPYQGPSLPIELVQQIANDHCDLKTLDSFAQAHPQVAAAPRFLWDRKLGPGVEQGTAESKRLMDFLYAPKLKTDVVQGPLPHSVSAAQLLDDGTLAVAYGKQGKLVFSSAADQTVNKRELTFPARIENFTVSKDGKRLAVALDNQVLEVHDLVSGQRTGRFVHTLQGHDARTIELSDVNEQLLVHLGSTWGGERDYVIAFHQGLAQNDQSPSRTKSFYGDIYIRPRADGKVVFLDPNYRKISIWNPQSNETQELGASALDVIDEFAYSPSYSHRGVVSHTTGWPSFSEVNISDVRTKKGITLESGAESLAFSPDGNFVVTELKGRLATYDLSNLEDGPVHKRRDTGCGHLVNLSAEGHALSVKRGYFTDELRITSADHTPKPKTE
jgi:hypothetical protein